MYKFKCVGGCENECVVSMQDDNHVVPTKCLYTGEAEPWEKVIEHTPIKDAIGIDTLEDAMAIPLDEDPGRINRDKPRYLMGIPPCYGEFYIQDFKKCNKCHVQSKCILIESRHGNPYLY